MFEEMLNVEEDCTTANLSGALEYFRNSQLAKSYSLSQINYLSAISKVREKSIKKRKKATTYFSWANSDWKFKEINF